MLHSLSVLSSLLLARVLPSGEKATDQTPCLWPVQTPRSLPVTALQRRIALSISPGPPNVANRLLSGEKTTPKTEEASKTKFVRKERVPTSHNWMLVSHP